MKTLEQLALEKYPIDGAYGDRNSYNRKAFIEGAQAYQTTEEFVELLREAFEVGIHRGIDATVYPGFEIWLQARKEKGE